MFALLYADCTALYNHTMDLPGSFPECACTSYVGGKLGETTVVEKVWTAVHAIAGTTL